MGMLIQLTTHALHSLALRGGRCMRSLLAVALAEAYSCKQCEVELLGPRVRTDGMVQTPLTESFLDKAVALPSACVLCIRLLLYVVLVPAKNCVP